MFKSIINLIVIIIIVKLWLSVGLATIFNSDSNGYGDSYNIPKSLPPLPSPVFTPSLSLGSFLQVTNRDSTDVYIKLVDPHSRSLVRALYVKSNSTDTLWNIPTGTYEVQYFYGKGWDSKARLFARNKSFSSDTHKFLNNHGLEITLGEVGSGNATTSGGVD